jgi:hypothetical protein
MQRQIVRETSQERTQRFRFNAVWWSQDAIKNKKNVFSAEN